MFISTKTALDGWGGIKTCTWRSINCHVNLTAKHNACWLDDDTLLADMQKVTSSQKRPCQWSVGWRKTSCSNNVNCHHGSSYTSICRYNVIDFTTHTTYSIIKFTQAIASWSAWFAEMSVAMYSKCVYKNYIKYE